MSAPGCATRSAGPRRRSSSSSGRTGPAPIAPRSSSSETPRPPRTSHRSPFSPRCAPSTASTVGGRSGHGCPGSSSTARSRGPGPGRFGPRPAATADREAEERAWVVVRAAYAEHEPVRARPPLRWAPAFAVLLGAAAVAAAAFSPPGRAVVDAVRRTIGIEHAAPALFRLPAPGRLLVSGNGGTWLVAADGSKRRLGDYTQAAWSPHGLFVVAATGNELATLEPRDGSVHWSLARPRIAFPRWGGSRTDTRV